MRNFGQTGGVSSKPRRNSRKNVAGKGFIAAHADYRREDFVFQRTQSLNMQNSIWESRARPIRHWGFNFVANLADMFA
jgi:hypothetical protein